MPLTENIKCDDCIYLVDVTSICSEYNALVNPEEVRNCYFYRAIPVLEKPKEDKPVWTAPKKTAKAVPKVSRTKVKRKASKKLVTA